MVISLSEWRCQNLGSESETLKKNHMISSVRTSDDRIQRAESCEGKYRYFLFLVEGVCSMRKTILGKVALTLLTALALCATASVASAAGVVQGSVVKLSNPSFPSGAGANGEFSVDVKSSGVYDGITDFYTFCVEKNQTFVPGSEMDVVALSKSTLGLSPAPVLTKQVAWLFIEYTRVRAGLAGAIANFYRMDSAANMNSDADALQNAIWHYTAPSQVALIAGNKYITLLGSHAFEVNNLVVGANDIGGVSIMQMKTGGTWSGPSAGLGTYVGGTNRQDQLYVDLTRIPPPSTVPEPASIAMWLSVAVGGMVARRRRTAQAA